jgi:hypothetical protein
MALDSIEACSASDRVYQPIVTSTGVRQNPSWEATGFRR